MLLNISIQHSAVSSKLRAKQSAMGRHELLNLFLCCATIHTTTAAALSFDYDFSTADATNLVFMGDSSYARGDRISLTKLGNWSTGRVAHRQLVRLWDGPFTTSFTTAFSFAIGRNSTDQADGMAFYVGPPTDTLPADTTGGFLGLIPNATAAASPRTVGVEFDTCRNAWDPQGNVIDHVGVDVNSIASRNVRHRVAGAEPRRRHAYDAGSRMMAVSLAVNGTEYSVEAEVDLRAAGLPQDAAVGFSAATGNLVESHQLLSWSFNSTADGSSSSAGRPPVVSESKMKRTKTYIIASTSSILGISLLAFAVFLAWKKQKWFLQQRWRSTNAPRIASLLRSQIKSYTYSEVRKMTKSFAYTLGKGG
uniref:Legume lectin domain-containing protein n=1 Tax=Leersia perrieri TaxID=77586 RepID=A0A0D9X6S3_9ORYZ